jgi:hypothetical protein
MRPLRILETVGGQTIETDDIPQVIDPVMIMNRTDTVLDPEVLEYGCWIKLPFSVLDYARREIQRVWVPPVEPMLEDGMMAIHPITWVANQILRVCRQFNAQETPATAVKRMVLSYQSVAERELVGKRGLIRNVMVGARMQKSGRAVLIPNGNYSPDTIGIPGRFFVDMGIEHDDLILVGRNPTIWSGSIEILKARRTPSDCVELHPLIFWQFGGDCDGDDLYFVPVPPTDECQEEAGRELLGFCQTHATWKKQALEKDPSPEVDWENPTADTKRRFGVTGFSVSPEDVMSQNSEVWDRIEAITGKELREQCLAIANGLDPDEVQEILREKNAETLRMKKHLGLIGLACNRLKIMASTVPHWVESANIMSERLQQVLLDSKHLSGDTYSVFDALAVLNKTGKWKAATVPEALAMLGSIPGIEAGPCKPILEAVFEAYPLRLALEDILPANVDRRKYHVLTRKIGSTISTSTVMGTFVRTLAKDGFGSFATRLQQLTRKYSTGLANMAVQFYPLHELIAGREPNRGLTRRVINQGILDGDGPCRQAWDVWHEIAQVSHGS